MESFTLVSILKIGLALCNFVTLLFVFLYLAHAFLAKPLSLKLTVNMIKFANLYVFVFIFAFIPVEQLGFIFLS